jgi:4-aminobutyrate aminotransferase-like enzyme
MALKSLEKHADPKVAEQVTERGERFKTALAGLGAVSGLGLMLGLELPPGTDGGAVIKTALKAGLITLADGPGGNVLAIVPAFSIDDEEMDFAADWLRDRFG